MAETLPPLTTAELETAIANPHFSSYVVFGKATDKAWKIALNVQKFLAAVRVVLVKASAEAEVRELYGPPAGARALVFGFGPELASTLTKAKSEDALAVMNAIWDARRSA